MASAFSLLVTPFEIDALWLTNTVVCCSSSQHGETFSAVAVYAVYTITRMWADAKPDGRPAEYRWRRLQKFLNSIPCTTLQSLAETRCWSAMQ